MSSRTVVLAITGPTAVGKTSLTLELASKRDISIVSIDSRQIYKEIDIGSAKPSLEERKGIPHYLVDLTNLESPVSAGQYHKQVLAATSEIIEAKRMPVWIGGSTLYFHSLLFGIADIPSIDEAIRKKVTAEYQEDPKAALERLQQIDPSLADGLDASKSHRIIRGLEVFDATHKNLSTYHHEMAAPNYPFDVKLIVLERDRQELYSRINGRVDQMLGLGLLEEVESILSRRDGRSDLPGLNSIGYKEVISYLDGSIDQDEMIRLIKRNTRRYAKRQITWFKKYSDTSTSLNLSNISSEEAASKIIELID